MIYRRQLIATLNQQLWSGKISGSDYVKIRWKSRKPEFMMRFADEIETAARIAGDWVDDLWAWMKKLADWLVANWPTVLKILLTLVVMV